VGFVLYNREKRERIRMQSINRLYATVMIKGLVELWL